ncbi:MAG: hypothetical protein ACRC0M_06330 [Legionella sp.]
MSQVVKGAILHYVDDPSSIIVEQIKSAINYRLLCIVPMFGLF